MPPVCCGHNAHRESGMVRGEAICDAPVSVPDESISDGSQVPNFWSADVCN